MADTSDGDGGPLASNPSATAAVAQSRLGANDPGPVKSRQASSARDGSLYPAERGFQLGERVTYGASHRSYEREPGDPIYRPLRVFTRDPEMPTTEGAAAVINIPYEPLKPGPQGRRFKLVASTGPGAPFSKTGRSQGYDLEDRRILIQSGRAPSSSDPEFHHQMVYAVCASVYAAFRTALGREAAWAFPEAQLLLKPHGSIGRQALYSREHKSLEFGWFQTKGADGRMPPSSIVFTCLSHDIVAHEVTHALLDGLRAQFSWVGNPDVPAFHEGFADLVAVLLRLSYKEVARRAIQRSNGDLSRGDLFQDIAQQVAKDAGGNSTVRRLDLRNEPQRYDPKLESHELGTILVSAVLRALIDVYDRKSVPLIRLAVGSNRKLRSGEMATDLLDLLAHLTSRLAAHFLNICIRALDYCPPVDIEFGEYLRALITADADLVPDDVWGYREALIQSFVARRIYPRDVMSMTEDALVWRGPETPKRIPDLAFSNLRFAGDPGRPAGRQEVERQADLLGAYVALNPQEFGCVRPGDQSVNGHDVGPPTVESIRSLRRVGPDGQIVFDVVAEIIQKREDPGGGGFAPNDFFGGATVLLGPLGDIRYVIKKRIDDDWRLQRARETSLQAFDLAHPFCATVGRTREGPDDGGRSEPAQQPD